MKCKSCKLKKMYPVFDKFNWLVGNLCDCGHFEGRIDLPSYKTRYSELISDNDRRKFKKWK